MLKIETTHDDGGTIVRLIGRIDSQNVGEIEANVRGNRDRLTLDLEEVTLVDMDTIEFLLKCESQGVTLRHCLPYIRAWMEKVRETL